MKSYNWIVLMFATLAIVIAGCSKSTQSIDTGPVEKSFASADPTSKTSADKAISAIKAGDYSGALAELKTLAANAKLTPEQKQAITDLMAKVQKAITDMATKAQGEAGKAVGDLQKSLPK